MTDLASIADEWWHKSQPVAFQGGAEPVKMEQPDYYEEHRNIVKLLEDTGKSLLNEAKDQKNEATAMAKKLNAPNPFYHLRGGEFNLDHLDMLSRASQALYGDLTPEKVVSGAVDAVQDLLKSPEQREKEKRQKAEEERIQKEKEEREAGKWSSYITPFFHLSGGATDKYLAIAKEFAKKAGYKDWDSLRRADDGEHKLELRGVKFGRKGYGDFIKYSLDEGEDEARKHRDAYLARATKIKGDWAKDMYSPNSLAIKILWGGGYSGGNIFDTISSIRFGPLDTDLLAQGLRQANPNASKIYDGLKGMFGGAKTEAELDAMKVRDLIEYGKTLGVKGLDGKTKMYIMDRIMAHEKTMPETQKSSEPQTVTPTQLIRMLMMEHHLEKEIIPLAKREGIERILHKNKKQLVTEIMEKQSDFIDDGMNIEKVPQYVMYLFGKAENPYADEDEDEDEEEEEEDEEEEEPEEVYVTQYVYDTNPYLVENAREGLAFKDRSVFDAVTEEEEGTLGDMPELAKLVEENETVIIVEKEEKKPESPTRSEFLKRMREKMEELIKYNETILDGNADVLHKKYAREDIKAITNQLDKLDSFEEIEGEPLPLRDLRIIYGENHSNYKEWVKKFKKGEGVEKWEYPAKKGSGRPTLAPQDVLEGKKDNPVVEETIEEPMDDSDIRQYLPNAKIMRYSALARISDIEQLLPTDKSYVVLLYENTPGSGHWVALLRYGRTIEFFCSYGSKIDAPLRWQNPRDNAMLGQTAPFLSQLLNKAKRKFRAIHNPVAYQSKRDGVATCGAWDVMRINQMKNHNQDLQDFHHFMESVKKETGLTYDEIVVNYVSKR